MLDHTGIGVAGVDRSATFYDAALGALGVRRVMQLPEPTAPAASAMASITQTRLNPPTPDIKALTAHH